MQNVLYYVSLVCKWNPQEMRKVFLFCVWDEKSEGWYNMGPFREVYAADTFE